jgi:hypothetical protein
MIYTVIVMRPVWFLHRVTGFSTLQDLQYVAIAVKSDTAIGAGTESRLEAYEADRAELHNSGVSCEGLGPDDYTVLGIISHQGGYRRYRPWLNGDMP